MWYQHSAVKTQITLLTMLRGRVRWSDIWTQYRMMRISFWWLQEWSKGIIGRRQYVEMKNRKMSLWTLSCLQNVSVLTRGWIFYWYIHLFDFNNFKEDMSFLIALVSYNSHTITIYPFKMSNPMILAYSKMCASITAAILEYFLHLEKKFCTF